MAKRQKWDEPAEKISVNLPQSNKVDLKVRLHHDGLTQAKFLRGVVRAYLEEDEDFMHWFNIWKLRHSKIKSPKRHVKSARYKDKGEQLSSQFGIKEGEIEDIFDILEKEHPEL